MSAHSHATQYIYGSMDTAAENCNEYILKVRDAFKIEMEHGDVYDRAQEAVYDALHRFRQVRQQPATTDVPDVLDSIEDALDATDETVLSPSRRSLTNKSLLPNT